MSPPETYLTVTSLVPAFPSTMSSLLGGVYAVSVDDLEPRNLSSYDPTVFIDNPICRTRVSRANLDAGRLHTIEIWAVGASHLGPPGASIVQLDFVHICSSFPPNRIPVSIDYSDRNLELPNLSQNRRIQGIGLFRQNHALYYFTLRRVF
jgi:hypothetical protein